jgi:hypothetical protein
MDKLYSSPMLVVRSLDVEKDSLKPWDGVEEMLGLEVPYLGAIGPTNTTGRNQEYLSISPRHHILLGLFWQFQRNLNSNIIRIH